MALSKPKMMHSKTICEQLEYPMYCVKVKDLLGFADLQPHAKLRELGLLHKYEDGMMVIFVSHQWLGNRHPDPSMKQFKVLQNVLKNVIDGKLLIDTHQMSTLHFGKQELITPEQVKELADAYLWYDYFGVPQLSTSYDAKAGADLMAAVRSIPNYIGLCKYFFILAPDFEHWTGKRCNYLSWKRRGWCRVEELARRLMHFNQMVIKIEGNLQAVLLDSQDYLCHSIGTAEFACCEMNHNCDGIEIPCDKVKVGHIASDMLTILQKQFGASDDPADLFSYRLLKCQEHVILKGLVQGERSNVAYRETDDKTILKAFLDDYKFVPSTKPPKKGFCPCGGSSVSTKVAPADGYPILKNVGKADDGGAGWGPLFFAVLSGNLKVADALLARGDNIDQQSMGEPQGVFLPKGCTPLHAVCALNPGGTGVQWLLQKKANAHMKNGVKNPPIAYACWNGHKLNAQALLDSDPSVVHDRTFMQAEPLMTCVDLPGRLDVLKVLVEAKGDVNGGNFYAAAPLMGAAMNGDVPMLRYLLEQKADITHKHTPTMRSKKFDLFMATQVHKKNPRLVTEFLSNVNGCEAMHHAAMDGSTSCMEALMEYRANPAPLNALKKTPLDLARLRGHTESMQVLMRATGASEEAIKAEVMNSKSNIATVEPVTDDCQVPSRISHSSLPASKHE
eukprot:gnl/MRDRNA2_/MRDRNA2_83604_c0_seq1.p1 gnl/MRDRNA2_/MRDRNA2_83604_c0~~gnl/MRDRNA2_/MRDRNA2_83604_c0_seq1.p1  ORF type:complete len:706 (-),score=120.43 gnl/MRDRNA2_/MRDRNA2_83604_c0_seq1:302-2326(-)